MGSSSSLLGNTGLHAIEKAKDGESCISANSAMSCAYAVEKLIASSLRLSGGGCLVGAGEDAVGQHVGSTILAADVEEASDLIGGGRTAEETNGKPVVTHG